MNRVFVLNHDKTPLMPCHPARARQLLDKGKAAVWRMKPFTIILKRLVENPANQETEVKIDPGSKTTGLAVVAKGEKKGWFVLWGANLEHRGEIIKKKLEQRAAYRRSRRIRKTRYRKARFNNRKRKEGKLAPSLNHRVENIKSWITKLITMTPIMKLVVESVKFDMQNINNPDINGDEYQQGTLQGCNVREYLLDKWNRTCAYCDKTDIPLEIEHIVPKSKGGSNRVSNLTLACRSCNLKKGNMNIKDFLSNDTKRLDRILSQTKQSQKDAAAVNITRKSIVEMLNGFGYPVEISTGAQTKYHRTIQGYDKDHWIDAACTGINGIKVYINNKIKPLLIKSKGRGSRQMCRVDKYGFPRSKPKSVKQFMGFQTGDIVKAVITKGKYIGTYIGKVAIRATGKFDIETYKGRITASYKCFKLLQKNDGYVYD